MICEIILRKQMTDTTDYLVNVNYFVISIRLSHYAITALQINCQINYIR